MSQIKAGTVTVTNGSATVTGSGTSWLGNVEAGHWFMVRQGQIPSATEQEYQIFVVAADVTVEGELQLTAPWAMDSASDVSYVIHTEFFPSGLPRLLPGDLESAVIFNEAMRKIGNGTLGLNNATVSTGTGTQTVPNALDSRTIPVNTVAALRALPGAKAGLRVDVAGDDTAFDGNGGSYIIEVKDGSPESDTVIFLDDTVHQARLIPFTISVTTSTGTQTLVEALDDRVRTHEFADQIEIIAHRGFRNVFVQNTLPALLSAISSGVNSIEFDVQTSAEGTPYLFHDASVNSLTDGSGSFVGLNDNVIDGLKYTQANGTPLEGVGIPKLQTLVNELRYRKSFIYPEIKAVNAPSDITGMVEMVKSAQMSKRCMWQSFNYSDLAVVRNADPDVEIGFLMGSSSTAQDVMDGVNSLLEDFGPNQGASVLVQFSVLLSNPSLVSYARDRGIDVGTWTVNEFKDVISLTNINVFRIMTDTNFKGVSQ